MKERIKKKFHYSRIIGEILVLVLIFTLIALGINNISKNNDVENTLISR